MTTETDTTPGHPHGSEPRRAIGLVLALSLALCGLLALFAWPAVNSEPHELPIVISGSQQATAPMEAALEKQDPNAFDVSVVDSRATAIDRIEHHQAYGGYAIDDQGVTVLTASARSAPVAQLLTRVGAASAARQHVETTTDDVVPAPADDPRGTGIAASMLPIAVGSIIVAVAATFLLESRRDRALVACGFAVFGGFALTALLQLWLGAVDGSYLANACVVTLGVAAVSMTILGFESLLGTTGLGIGALLMMLVGNALSGASSAPEMLPGGWGAAGQLLPVGATNTGLRSTAFFDGHGAIAPILVCVGWLVLGAVLQLVAAWRRRAGTPASESSDVVAQPSA